MEKARMLTFVILFALVTPLLGQGVLDSKNSEWRTLSMDSLKSLESKFENEDNLFFLNELHRTIEQQAEIKKDTVHLIWVYERMAWYTTEQNAILLLEKAISLAGTLADKQYKGDAMYFLGAFYYENNKPNLAIDKFIEAYKIGVSEKNHELIVDALNGIAAIKSEYGEHLEALDLQLESFSYLKSHANKIPNYYETYLISVDNLALSYLQLKVLDSARIYTQKALDWVLRHEDTESYPDFRILEAQVNYYDGNLVKARDSILKYYHTMELDGQADLLYYLGMVEGKLGRHKQKLEYFKRMDSTLRTIDFPLIDNTKELYQFLMLKKVGNTDEYIRRWMYYDSLHAQTAETIKTITFKDFDLPRIQNERKGVFAEIVLWQKNNVYLWWGVSLLVPLLIGISLAFFKAKGKLDKIRSISVWENEEKSPETFILDISPDMVKKIRENLNRWEADKGFLDISIDQKSLAELLHTNDTYISLIVNHYRSKNFSTYLKDLRMDYALQELRSNPEISFGKSVIQLAERFGFRSKELFSKTMKAKIGVTPAVFLRQLKGDNL